MDVVSFRLDDELAAALQRIGDELGGSERSKIIRRALVHFVRLFDPQSATFEAAADETNLALGMANKALLGHLRRNNFKPDRSTVAAVVDSLEMLLSDVQVLMANGYSATIGHLQGGEDSHYRRASKSVATAVDSLQAAIRELAPPPEGD